MAIKPLINGEDARNLAKVNFACVLCTLFVFIFGLVLWLWVGKPTNFYSENPIFQAKILLFITIALLSAYPVIFFARNRKSEVDTITVPALILALVKIELFILLMIPILAYLTTRGIGIQT